MKINKWLLVGITATLLTAFVIGASLYKRNEKKASDAAAAANADLLVRSHSPTLGPDAAPVTLVEFFDPECEACGALYPMVKKVMSEFDGKIRLVLRYMPLHKNSVYAATVLEGARKQGKYWEALELLFAKQPEWASHHAPRPELIPGYMRDLGLDMTRLDGSLSDSEPQSKIRQDQDDGTKLGVTRTPTFFVNGKMLHEIGYEQFKTAIGDALAGK